MVRPAGTDLAQVAQCARRPPCSRRARVAASPASFDWLPSRMDNEEHRLPTESTIMKRKPRNTPRRSSILAHVGAAEARIALIAPGCGFRKVWPLDSGRSDMSPPSGRAGPPTRRLIAPPSRDARATRDARLLPRTPARPSGTTASTPSRSNARGIDWRSAGGSGRRAGDRPCAREGAAAQPVDAVRPPSRSRARRNTASRWYSRYRSCP